MSTKKKKETRYVGVHLSMNQFRHIAKLADQHNRTLSGMMREVVDAGINSYIQNKKK